MLSHSGEKPYQCSLCDNGVAHNNLKSHMKSHSKESRNYTPSMINPMRPVSYTPRSRIVIITNHQIVKKKHSDFPPNELYNLVRNCLLVPLNK